MTAFFTCMAKAGTDVEDKCAAERRALTNCATAAVRWAGWRVGPGGAWHAVLCPSMLLGACWTAGGFHAAHGFFSAALPPDCCSLLLQARKGKTMNTINYHLQRISRMIRR